MKAPDLGISFTIPDAHARPTGCQNGIFCGRKLEEEEEEEGLLCIVKVGSEYDEEEEEGSLHFFFSSGRELVSQWENLPD